MSGTAIKSRTVLRRLAVRAALVAVFVGLTALAFLAGKGHTILVDNKDAEDGSVQAFDGVMVAVDRQEALELYAGDRDKAVVMGQVHTVSIEVIADGTKVVRKIRLPLGEEMLLLSVPMLAAGREPALVPFVAPQAAVPEEGVGNLNAFTSPGGEENPLQMTVEEFPAESPAP
jgi:hypothetical protein